MTLSNKKNDIDEIINSKGYHLFENRLQISIIKSILYHSTIFNNTIKSMYHFNNSINDKLLLDIYNLPSFIELKHNRYNPLYPAKLFTLSHYAYYFNHIINLLMAKYNKLRPITIWTNNYIEMGSTIQFTDITQNIGAIYIFYNDSEYYTNYDFYQELQLYLKKYFIISINKQYFGIIKTNKFTNKIVK